MAEAPSPEELAWQESMIADSGPLDMEQAYAGSQIQIRFSEHCFRACVCLHVRLVMQLLRAKSVISVDELAWRLVSMKDLL